MPSYRQTPLAKTLLGAVCALAAAAAVASPAFAWQSGWSYRTKVTLTPSAAGASVTLVRYDQPDCQAKAGEATAAAAARAHTAPSSVLAKGVWR